MLADILGKGGLRNLGFDIPRGKVTARQAVMLNKAQKELPSASDIDKADDIELQEIVENALTSIENLNQQVQEEPTEDLPMGELLGLFGLFCLFCLVWFVLFGLVWFVFFGLVWLR